ncbi:hypothetical protein ACCO45_012237 [Purpureocillium lilacinum]|uniref:Uncharacterized protein n=1 Tax=Purpureocillium lilacinum TaxID=33203 RepID=A0ACC4DFS9_PURLI
MHNSRSRQRLAARHRPFSPLVVHSGVIAGNECPEPRWIEAATSMASRCGNVSQEPPLDIGCGPQTRHARRWARESASLRLTEGAELKIYGDLRGICRRFCNNGSARSKHSTATVESRRSSFRQNGVSYYAARPLRFLTAGLPPPRLQAAESRPADVLQARARGPRLVPRLPNRTAQPVLHPKPPIRLLATNVETGIAHLDTVTKSGNSAHQPRSLTSSRP